MPTAPLVKFIFVLSGNSGRPKL